jgi:hypothetical protein
MFINANECTPSDHLLPTTTFAIAGMNASAVFLRGVHVKTHAERTLNELIRQRRSSLFTDRSMPGR